MRKTKLYPYQLEGVRLIEGFDGRAILADEMGLGKTLEALYWAWKYRPADADGPVVVVCPAHLKEMWRRQAAEHLGIRAEILEEQKVPADRLPPVDPRQTFVVNYEILGQPRRRGQSIDDTRSWWHWVNRLRPWAVIADEAHRLKESTALCSRSFKKLVRGVPHLLFLSGTPLVNRPIELFNILNMLRPDLFPHRFAFGSEYAHPWMNPWGRWEFRGGRNLDKLHRLLSENVMVRRLKKDVLQDLPAKRVTVVPVTLGTAARREYNEAVCDYLIWLEKQDPDAARRAAKAEELTKLGYLRRLAGRLKLDAVTRWIEDFLEGTDGKLLVGAVHRRVVRGLAEAFGRTAVAVDGDLDHRGKTAAFDRFNGSAGCRLLFGNLQAAGTGWSCTATSDGLIAEFPWTPGELEQFFARVHGIGRGVAGVGVNWNLMVAQDTIDEDLCKILTEKQHLLDSTLDGAVQAEENSVYEQLRAMTKARAERRRARARK